MLIFEFLTEGIVTYSFAIIVSRDDLLWRRPSGCMMLPCVANCNYLSMDFINVDDDPKQMYIYSRFLTRAETLF